MKKPAFAIAVKLGGPKLPPRYSERKESPVSERNHEQERPVDEVEFHDKGAAPKPTPESVCYRGAADVCGSCEYFSGGQCSFLAMPVDDGASCSRFEAKTQDQEEQTETPGMEVAEYK